MDIHSDDEIGQLADSIRSSTHTLREIILDMAHVLKEISDGNLNVEVTGQYTGDFTAIRDALEQILLSLNNALGQINTVADQVSSGAEQVSTSAQELSLGASEQAGSVEELEPQSTKFRDMYHKMPLTPSKPAKMPEPSKMKLTQAISRCRSF